VEHVKKMKASKYRFSFNENTANLAALSPDGRLKIWETTNGNLCHDWTPPVGLKSTCSCLCWVNNDTVGKPPKPKKLKKSTISSAEPTTYHIVFGTVQGSLLLLNYGLLEVENKLTSEHKEKINDVCYNGSKDTIYSGSNDKYIIEWLYPSMEFKSKWKADKHSVQRLKVSPDGSCILSAGRTIKVWDIDSKQLLQKFTGHPNPVTDLLFAPMTNGKAFRDECYFLSISEDDQLINAWHHDPSAEDNSAVCCFMAGSQPVCVDISLRESQQLKLAAACLDGKISIFTHALNGKLTKPMDSSLSVQFVKPENEKHESSPVRMLAIRLVEDDVLLLVYGTPVNPTFEKMKVSSLVNGAKIMRETSKSLLRGEAERGMLKSKEKNKGEKSVAAVVDACVPVRSAESRQLSTATGNSTFDKEREELTFGERLTAVAAPNKRLAVKTSRHNRGKPNALSVTQMLSQGLHSDDDRLIDTVLFKANKESIINHTIKRLPTNYVLTLINKIILRIEKNPARGYELTTWLRVLMSIHMTYLLSLPNLMKSLRGLYQNLESRTKMYPKLSKLHGRLDLLIAHMSARKQFVISTEDINESAVVFEDKDESEEDDENDNTNITEEVSPLSDDNENDSNNDSESEPSDSYDSDNEQINNENEKENDLSDDE